MDGKPEVKIGEWIQKGFELYKNNLPVLIPASLITLLLSSVTGGILYGPLAAGMILIVFALLDGAEPRPTAGDVFKGFDFFLQTLLFFLVWGILGFAGFLILFFIPCFGQLLSPLFLLVLQTAILFGLILIVDRRLDFWEASRISFEKVRANFLPFLGLAVLASLIGSLGAILCGIGIFLTFPIYVTTLVVAYRDTFADGASETAETPSALEPPEAPEADSSEAPRE